MYCNAVTNKDNGVISASRSIDLKGSADALGDSDEEYEIKGNQWIWFPVRPELSVRCRLQSPAVRQSFVGRDE